MPSEYIVDRMGRLIERRDFLRKVGLAAVGAIVGIIGLPITAQAYSYGCCNFCAQPISDVACYNQSACIWCWTCCNGLYPNHKYQCCEGYSSVSSNCNAPDCLGNWLCSYVVDLGRSDCCCRPV